MGRVHSCFDRTINIRTPTGRLLTLQEEGQLQAPLSLKLADKIDALSPFLPTGGLVVQHVPGVEVPHAVLKLVCSEAKEWDGRIRPVRSLIASDLYRKADALAAWMVQDCPGRGLVPLLNALQDSDGGLSAVCRRIYNALMPLLGNRRISSKAILRMVERVTGLGDGLTPSGDDLLVGFLAVLHVTGRVEAALPSIVHKQFLQEVMVRTSDLSTEFIRCALEGNFAEPVVLLIRSLFAPELHGWQSHASSLANVGHNSGIDAMVGIVLGSRLLSRSLEQQAYV